MLIFGISFLKTTIPCVHNSVVIFKVHLLQDFQYILRRVYACVCEFVGIKESIESPGVVLRISLEHCFISSSSSFHENKKELSKYYIIRYIYPNSYVGIFLSFRIQKLIHILDSIYKRIFYILYYSFI